MKPQSGRILDSAAVPSRRPIRDSLGRTARLARKELREILRDRRTIVTLVLMPLLLYPMLSITLSTFLLSNRGGLSAIDGASAGDCCSVAFESKDDWKLLGPYLLQGEKLLAGSAEKGQPSPPPIEIGVGEKQRLSVPRAKDGGSRISPVLGSDLQGSTAAGDCDLAIRIPRANRQAGREPIACELIYRQGSPESEAALDYVEQCLHGLNEHRLQGRLRRLEELGLELKRLGLASTAPTKTTRKPVATAASPALPLATFVPLLLVLMTITGAVYPAIDLTAGERERGTLEILMAAPVPRLALLMAKYTAVLTVSLLTAAINVAAMTTTILATGLGPLLFGPSGLSAGVVLLVFGLMILFASFFSAVLLALTSFARSFREAQIYLIPLMVASLTSGLLSLMPGLELSGILAVTPLINIVLLARDMLEGMADPLPAAAAVVSTLFYALAAIAAAARVFGGDAILLGGRGGWSDLFRRPPQASASLGAPAAMLCLALIFPAYFLLENLLGRWQGASLSARLGAASLITAAVLGGFPLALAAYCRVRIRHCCGSVWASPIAYLAAMLLGVSLWPFAHEVILLSDRMGLAVLDSQRLQSAKQLADELSRVPLVQVLLALAVAPALFEEFFFRGVLFSSFRPRAGAAGAILISSLVFGLFHVAAPTVLAVERFAPSVMLGIVLGWVRYRSGSLLPPILLHACHNGFLLLASCYRNELAATFRWAARQDLHLPLEWLAAAAALAALSAAMMSLATRPEAAPKTPRNTPAGTDHSSPATGH